jgi:hypothetical protein
MRSGFVCWMLFVGLAVSSASAEKYYLLVGVDATHYPGVARNLTPSPGPGYPGPVYDGDRLAGTADVGPVVTYQGTGAPMYAPNHLGSLSMMYRRGSVPIPPSKRMPLLGIEFLGGPLLDLDGDPNDTARSLVPMLPNTPAEIPASDSFIDLAPNFLTGSIGLVDFDATGCNEGGPGIGPDVATVLFTIAGTQPDGSKTGPINAGIDTRTGTLTAFTGSSGQLTGVYRITNLGFEFWEDSVDPYSATAAVLGSMQFLGTFRGWLIERDAALGGFPTLAGQGLGGTRWPEIDTTHVGQTFNTANGLMGGSTTIATGVAADNFSATGNGGLALTDFGGDLGAYLDSVVVPRLPAGATRFVYLESAGFGINNSSDPIFTDTISYDVVLIAATGCGSQLPGDSNCDGVVSYADINPFVAALTSESAWQAHANPGCGYVCANDVNRDGVVSYADINPFVRLLSGQ